MTAEPEVPLVGGNVAPVVRVGDTVRRVAGPWTPAVHALLAHLHTAGFGTCPRPLGYDDAGREVLSYVPGDAGIPPFPGGMFSDHALTEVGRLLRRYHDAVETFVPPSDARWRTMPGAPPAGDATIIAHNDLAPYNTIYRGGAPAAFIDWDLAAPATPEWDLAYAAWRFVPLYNDADLPDLGWPTLDRPRRLRVLCDAYHLEHRAGFVDVIEARMQSVIETLRTWGEAGVPGFAEMWRTGHADGPRRDLDHLERIGPALEDALR